MAKLMEMLKTTKNVKPPRCLFYSTAGLGKTSLASEFPNPAFIFTEEGLPADTEVFSFPLVQDSKTGDGQDIKGTGYDQFVDYLRMLGTEPHDRKTLVIDTIDKLEPMIISKVCAENGWPDIEEPGYGKGYIAYKDKFADVLRMLNKLRTVRNMAIVILAHFDIKRFDEPGTEGYDRYVPRLHKKVVDLLVDDVDMVGFINQKKVIKTQEGGFNKKHSHAEGHGTRVIYLEERPGFVAKSRYKTPTEVVYHEAQGYKVLADYFPGMDTPPTAIPEPVLTEEQEASAAVEAEQLADNGAPDTQSTTTETPAA